MQQRVKYFKKNEKYIEAQRIEERTKFDLEMIKELGYCSGIENYSRYLSGRNEGEAPPTLYDYLPEDTIVFVDESHVSLPQIKGMYRGDRSRKETLADYGFRPARGSQRNASSATQCHNPHTHIPEDYSRPAVNMS